MKKIIGLIGSYSLYWIGDLISKLTWYVDWIWLFKTYQTIMIWSIGIQEWADLDEPWRKL